MVTSALHNDKSPQVFLNVKVNENIDIVIKKHDANYIVRKKSVAMK